MAKTGRNDPCPCASGKKYKRCCLAKDQAAGRTALAAQDDADHREDELASASNAAVDLVREGKLDQAEQAARALLERVPDVHDGWDRLGMVYEARGDRRQAADCYRKVIDVIRAHPDNYDPDVEGVFRRLVTRLDPDVPA